MAKYRVYGIMTANVVLGEYEAADRGAAIDMANVDNKADWYPSICHECSRKVELSEIDGVVAEVIE